MPRSLLLVACPFVDRTHTTLRISCPTQGEVEVVDKTVFGRNTTRVSTDGKEIEQRTKGRGKPYMLSATVESEASSTLHCRLTSRGPGWYTRQVRFVSAEGNLVERNVLEQPGVADVVCERVFTRANDENLQPPVSAS